MRYERTFRGYSKNTSRRVVPLGAKLKDPEWLVRQFLSFLAQRQVTVITTELALQWAIEPRNVQPFYRHRRLAEVRRFARYASAVDSRHEIPPQGLLPYRKHRAQPYIYTAEEIVAVINAAKQLRGRIRPPDVFDHPGFIVRHRHAQR